jgi:hypothetical protein
VATQTFQHSSFAGGIVRVEFDVNDANWRVSRVRCINDSAYPAVARILQNGVEVFTAVAPAGQMTSWNTTGVQLGWDSVDGGIVMGGYEMLVRWPGAV